MDHSQVLFFFRLVILPLQPEVVEPYSLWGTWFPSCLSLEEMSRIQIFRT
jgi:hypothetical protein